MGPIIDAIWQLPWYKVFIIAVVDDFIFMVKTWPIWVLIAVVAGVRLIDIWWGDEWRAKIKRKRNLKKNKATYEDHGTYIKRPEKPDKDR